MSNTSATKITKKNSTLEDGIASIFVHAPHLPQGVRSFLVKIAPWFTLIVGILGLALVLFSVIGSMLLVFAELGTAIIICIGFVDAILKLVAFKPLSSHKKLGWNLLLYAIVLSTIVVCIGWVIGYGSYLSLIRLLIGFYLLFEIRGYYRD